jgi:extradiol dioxygenase family protein
MTGSAPRTPIFHLSFPVRDLDEAIRYYTATLGGVRGRKERTWADVALFGAQLTLQHVPEDVLQPMPRSRHFGATLSWQEWERLTALLTDFVEAPHVDHQGTDYEQAKAMVQDPSGNLIEIKAYRQPVAVLGSLARAADA